MSRRLLIVSPHFPPINAPDMQRVRMSLPHFLAGGWDVTVLAADDREPMAPVEPDLLGTIPPAVRVVRVSCLSRGWTSRLGVNNLGWRMLPGLAQVGARIIREWRPDVVYFSTTQFITLPLGRIWRRRFRVPFVVDLQDPWVSNYHSRPGAPRPPGGWKYRIAQAFARTLEGWTLSRASHVLCVSEQYPADLARRYSWWIPARGSVLAFGAPDVDFALARKKALTAPVLLPPSRGRKIAYAGRLGPDMLPALEVLFAAAAGLKDTPRPVEFFFFGTSYAPAAQAEATTSALARRHGIAHLVHEHPARIGYLDSIRLLVETDVALLLGSDDSGYSPSKVYPTLLAARPTLAVAPAGSVLERIIGKLGGARMISFQDVPGGDARATTELVGVLAQDAAAPSPAWGFPLDADRLQNAHSAAAVAQRQLAIFATLGPT